MGRKKNGVCKSRKASSKHSKKLVCLACSAEGQTEAGGGRGPRRAREYSRGEFSRGTNSIIQKLACSDWFFVFRFLENKKQKTVEDSRMLEESSPG